MKKMIIIIVVAAVVFAAGFLCLNCGPGCGTKTPPLSDTTVVAESNNAQGCNESSCSSNCSTDKTAVAESPTCGGCGENSCTKSCSTNPTNSDSSLKSAIPSCSLSEPELQSRKLELQQGIFSRPHTVKNETGYQFTFKESKEFSNELLEFINFERGCCSSFSYGLIFEPNNAATHLQIYGSKEIKTELKNGFTALGLAIP
ncbi:MAG: hypothetical protein IPM77_07105 [Crocinitomicaceae bacterium]|nr:hypothetical protein [Crocinitomicaceae bacterium]